MGARSPARHRHYYPGTAMLRSFAQALRAPLGEILPLLVLGVGLAGVLGTARAAGEITYILECSGAIGGTRRPE